MKLQLTSRTKQRLQSIGVTKGRASRLMTVAQRLIGVVQNSVARFDDLTRSRAPRAILRTLDVGVLDFFSRRRPVGDKYAYEAHFAPALDNVPTKLDRFHLVGRNWRHDSGKPLAVAFGFNDWKYGFVADYCPDVRLAFAPRKHVGRRARADLRHMQPAPVCIYVWGYTDPAWLQKFVRQRGIPLIRVEDAFLRSADLGASHATPYSLVFDRKGLYYNTGEPNDLTDILQDHDFAADRKLMEDARKALDLLIEKRLSKYNPPNLYDPARHFSVKTRKRVLVIGQVDNDAAVRMGNPEKWRMSDILRLAKLENPDAEILYRPHPETYRGYQRTRFKALLVENFAAIVPPEGSLLDMLDTVDHVYTISSLSGLEALVRGIKVTTLGTPFYAGWGLTDDRVAPQKDRQLSALELFAGTYLKYPRYLADLEDSYCGFQSAVLRVLGDRQMLLHARRPYGEVLSHVLEGQAGPHAVPSLVLNFNKSQTSAESFALAFFRAEYRAVFERSSGPLAQRAFLTLMVGSLDESSQVDRLLTNVLPIIHTEAANKILLDLHKFRPGPYLAKHFAWLASRVSDGAHVHDIYRHIDEEASVSADQERPGEPTGGAFLFVRERAADRAEVLFADARFAEAFDAYVLMLLHRSDSIHALTQAAECARQQFDFQSAYEIAYFALQSGSGDAQWVHRLLSLTDSYVAPSHALENAVAYTVHRPSVMVSVIDRLSDLGILDAAGISREAFIQSLRLDRRRSIHYVHSLISLGNFAEALELVQELSREMNTYQLAVLYTQVLAYLERFDEAEKVIDLALQYHKKSLVFEEAIKLCFYMDKYHKAKALLDEAGRLSIDVGEVVPRKTYFGLQDTERAFATFKSYKVKRQAAVSFPEKYCHHPAISDPSRSLFIAPIFGPGDEIRFASIYNLLSSLVPHRKVVVGCEPRFESLFRRSFAEIGIDIVPVARVLRSPRIELSKYDRLPNADLLPILDNQGVQQIEQSDDFLLVSDLLAAALPTMSSFPGSAYLKDDEVLTQRIGMRLPRKRPLVGLSWRSSITLQSRMEHYLTVEDILPILSIDNIDFINLQYDDCSDELAWLEKRAPGRIINLADIDQYNDFESVASLMRNLDLILAPCTTVVELAGALGCPTWLLSNSSELKWRKRDSTNVDVWHNSVEHVEGAQVRNKRMLVNHVCMRLRQRYCLSGDSVSAVYAESNGAY